MGECGKTLSAKTIDGLLQRTKRKGRGRDPETILLEADQNEKKQTARGAKVENSSSEDDTPRRAKKEDCDE